MANAVVLGSASSQSSLLLHLRPISKLSLATRTPAPRFSCNVVYPTLAVSSKRISTLAGVVSSDSTSSAVIADTVDSTKGGTEIEPDIGGEGEGEGEGESSDESGKKNKMGMSMSQKLTLGYAALVGVGGLMGYLKSGSQKSLLAGGVSASLLYYVYTQLPTKPVLASSIGLGLSAALLGVMGSRFMKSGKVFPAGVVSLISLVMTGGYLHGIMRSLH
ncbi:hypothetical protein AB3S75_020546 [Citrus x aurantiifolia]